MYRPTPKRPTLPRRSFAAAKDRDDASMAPLWDPRRVLGLQDDGETQWACVATVAEWTDDTADVAVPRRCGRKLRVAEVNAIRKLTAEMAAQLPDQIDYNVLLHLARASLCADHPDPHQGHREAAVIYAWTGLMGAEAARVREPREDEREVLDAAPPPPDADETGDAWLPRPPRAGVRLVRGAGQALTRALLLADRPPTIAERRRSSTTSPMTPKIILVPSSLAGAVAPPAHQGPNTTTLPPSPPDSATYAHTDSSAASPSASAFGSASPATEPFPLLPLHRPVPLSIRPPSGLLLLDNDQALPTATTMDLSDLSSASDEATPHPARRHGVSPAAPDGSSARAKIAFVFPPATTAAIPPPLPTSTTTITNTSSDLSTRRRSSSHPGRPSLRPLPRGVRMAPPPPTAAAAAAAAASPGLDPASLAGHAEGSSRVFGGAHDGPGGGGGGGSSSMDAGVGGLGAGKRGGGGGAALGPALVELEEYNRLLQETAARHEVLLRQMAELRTGMAALRDGDSDGREDPVAAGSGSPLPVAAEEAAPPPGVVPEVVGPRPPAASQGAELLPEHRKPEMSRGAAAAARLTGLLPPRLLRRLRTGWGVFPAAKTRLGGSAFRAIFLYRFLASLLYGSGVGVFRFVLGVMGLASRGLGGS